MKFAVAATSLASFAVTQAQTCQEAITTAITPIGTAGALGNSIAGLCGSTDLKASLEVALSNCPAGSDATLKSLVKVLAKIVCEQDGDTFCFDGFAKLIPWMQLIQGGGSVDFAFMDSFAKENLQAACGSPYCSRKYTELAIQLATGLPEGEEKKVALGYAKDLATTCAKAPEEPDMWCAEKYKEFFAPSATFTIPPKDEVCKDGEVRPCIKAALSQRLVFADYSNVCAIDEYICDKATIVDSFSLEQLNSLCGSPSSTKPVISNLYTFALDNIGGKTLEELKNALLSDMVFNLHETDLKKFKFQADVDVATGRRLLQDGDTVKVEYDGSYDRVKLGCSDFMYPTLETKLDKATATCSVAYPEGYTPPEDDNDEDSLTGGGATPTSALCFVAAAAATASALLL